MRLELWRPTTFNGFGRVESAMDRVFEDFFAPARDNGPAPFAPPVDITETPEGLVLRADLPGLRPSDLQVQVENGILTLRGERKDEQEQKGATYHTYERRYGSFVRSFELPVHIDPAQVKARYTDGVLTVTLPKKEEAKPKAIQIQVE